MGLGATPTAAGALRSSPSLTSVESSSFLTEAQRAALDAALAAKQSEQVNGGGKGGSRGAAVHQGDHAPRSKGAQLHERHVTRKTPSGKARTEKKGGGGGKYTWGSELQPVEPGAAALDPGDPNYDTDEENPVYLESERSAQIKEFKQAVEDLLEEYWASGDVAEVARVMREMDLPLYDHFFVKKALTRAMDKHDREREMTSMLLSALYSEVIAPDQMLKGFGSLVDALDDLTLDVPDALDLASTFIARAVVDDVLPPSFVTRMPEAPGTTLTELRNKCEVHLGARHAAERLLRCWGSGAGLGHEETKDAMRKVLEEYLDSHDGAEAERCLGQLAVPFFHHELVKQALHMAMTDPATMEAICVVLKQLSDIGRVSELQMTKGFTRVAGNLADTVLDNPAARERFTAITERAKKEGWLDAEAVQAQEANGVPANGSHALGVQAFKGAVVTALKEYFASNDMEEVVRQVQDLNEPGLHHILVNKAVQLAMDRKDREREMVSQLLVALSPEVVTPDQMAAGFTRLLACVEDLALDIPDALHTLSLFLGRAVVDELLPPSFLTACLPALRAGSEGVSVVKATYAMLSARHAAERLQSCWHGGARTIEQLREAMEQLIKEYNVGGDAREASRCLMDLDVPHYHHELVKRCLLAAFELEGRQAPGAQLMELLRSMEATGEINQTQMRMGFSRVEADMADIILDAPHAKELFAQYKQRAVAEGWLVEEEAP